MTHVLQEALVVIYDRIRSSRYKMCMRQLKEYFPKFFRKTKDVEELMVCIICKYNIYVIVSIALALNWKTESYFTMQHFLKKDRIIDLKRIPSKDTMPLIDGTRAFLIHIIL